MGHVGQEARLRLVRDLRGLQGLHRDGLGFLQLAVEGFQLLHALALLLEALSLVGGLLVGNAGPPQAEEEAPEQKQEDHRHGHNREEHRLLIRGERVVDDPLRSNADDGEAAVLHRDMPQVIRVAVVTEKLHVADACGKRILQVIELVLRKGPVPVQVLEQRVVLEQLLVGLVGVENLPVRIQHEHERLFAVSVKLQRGVHLRTVDQRPDGREGLPAQRIRLAGDGDQEFALGRLPIAVGNELGDVLAAFQVGQKRGRDVELSLVPVKHHRGAVVLDEEDLPACLPFKRFHEAAEIPSVGKVGASLGRISVHQAQATVIVFHLQFVGLLQLFDDGLHAQLAVVLDGAVHLPQKQLDTRCADKHQDHGQDKRECDLTGRDRFLPSFHGYPRTSR